MELDEAEDGPTPSPERTSLAGDSKLEQLSETEATRAEANEQATPPSFALHEPGTLTAAVAGMAVVLLQLGAFVWYK